MLARCSATFASSRRFKLLTGGAGSIDAPTATTAVLRGWMPCLGPTTVDATRRDSRARTVARSARRSKRSKAKGCVLRGTFTAGGPRRGRRRREASRVVRPSTARADSSPDARRPAATDSSRSIRPTTCGSCSRISGWCRNCDFAAARACAKRSINCKVWKFRPVRGNRASSRPAFPITIRSGSTSFAVRRSGVGPIAAAVARRRRRTEQRRSESRDADRAGVAARPRLAVAAGSSDRRHSAARQRRSKCSKCSPRAARCSITICSAKRRCCPGISMRRCTNLPRKGLVSSDAFGAVRALTSDERQRATPRAVANAQTPQVGASTMAGRWSLFPGHSPAVVVGRSQSTHGRGSC